MTLLPSSSPPRRLGLAAAALAAFVLAALPLLATQEAQTVIENLKSTLQRHPNGRVKTLLTADRAELPDENTIHGHNVTITIYTPDGLLEAFLETDEVIIDKEHNEGTCPGSASFERHAPRRRGETFEENGISISGNQVRWVGEENKLSIESNATVTIYREGKSIAEGWK